MLQLQRYATTILKTAHKNAEKFKGQKHVCDLLAILFGKFKALELVVATDDSAQAKLDEDIMKIQRTTNNFAAFVRHERMILEIEQSFSWNGTQEYLDEIIDNLSSSMKA